MPYQETPSQSELPLFEGGLANLNNFYGMPAFWQPIVLKGFRLFITEEYIKTRSELAELKSKVDNMPRNISEREEAEIARPWSEAMRVAGFFAHAINDILAGTQDVTLSNYHEIEPERKERLLALVTSPEQEYLRNFLSDLEFDDREELMLAWTILDVYVSTHSEGERDKIAENIRGSA